MTLDVSSEAVGPRPTAEAADNAVSQDAVSAREAHALLREAVDACRPVSLVASRAAASRRAALEAAAEAAAAGSMTIVRIGGEPIGLDPLLGRLGEQLGVPAAQTPENRRQAVAALYDALQSQAVEGGRLALLIDAEEGVSAKSLLVLLQLARSGALISVVAGRDTLADALSGADDERLRTFARDAVRIAPPGAVEAARPQDEPMAPEAMAASLEPVQDFDADPAPEADADAAPVEEWAEDPALAEIDAAAAAMSASLDAVYAARAATPRVEADDEEFENGLELTRYDASPRRWGAAWGLGAVAAVLVGCAVLFAAPTLLASLRAPKTPPAAAPSPTAILQNLAETATPVGAATAAASDAPVAGEDPALPSGSAHVPQSASGPQPADAAGFDIEKTGEKARDAMRSAAEKALDAARAGADALAKAGVLSDTLDSVAAEAEARRVDLARARQLEELDTAAIEQRIDSAVLIADRRISAEQYTQPIGASAYDVLLHAWEVAPEDARLVKRFERLREIFKGEARRAMSQERFSDFYRFNEIVERIDARRPL